MIKIIYSGYVFVEYDTQWKVELEGKSIATFEKQEGVSGEASCMCEIDRIYRKSTSIIVRFARLGANGQPVIINNERVGIDTSVWDPRGTVKHWGETSFTIQLLTPVKEDGLLEDDVVDVKACFETEPKENIDIDIYY